MNSLTRVAPVALVLTLIVPAAASAHRLDEYLQATRIAVDADRIDIELSLTPGSDVADAVVAVIDRDADGRISDDEADAYAKRVSGDLRLHVDDTAITLALSPREFPDAGDMRAGVGVIRLTGTAVLARRAGGHHRVSYDNAHMPGMSVFLVNTLTPRTPDVLIGKQSRDEFQRTLVVDYEIARPGQPVMWLLTAVAAIGGLVIGRGRRRQTDTKRPRN
jgi:hypothetical protein